DPHWGFQAPPILPPPGPAPAVVASLALLGASLPQHPDEPCRKLTIPARLEFGLEVEGPSGVETFLLLARRTPLPLEDDLRRLLGKPAPGLPLKPDQLDGIAIEEGLLKRIDPGRARTRGPLSGPINDSLVQMLVKLQPHFELLQGVRFAHVD